MSRFSVVSMSFAALAVVFCGVSDVSAQRGGFGGMQNNRAAMLGNEAVLEKLEVVDEQRDDIKALQGEMRDVMRESFSGMREKFQGLDQGEREDLMDEIRMDIEEKMVAVDEKVAEILLPFQIEMLDQMVLQSKMARGGMSGLLRDKAFVKAAGLSDSDVKALEKKAEEVQEWVKEENKRIRKEAQEKMLSVLSSEQQEKIAAMIGEDHEIANQRGRGGDRGGRGADRGGRGGDRGGRGGDRGGRQRD